jgi:tetratricopeptide (TPR) repeat protein
LGVNLLCVSDGFSLFHQQEFTSFGDVLILSVRRSAQCMLPTLSTFGKAAWYRENGLQFVEMRHFNSAILELERAWQMASADPIGQRLLPRYSQSLALALLEIGRDRSALQYLNLAINTKTQSPSSGLLLIRSFVWAYGGEFNKAKVDLEAANTHTSSPDQFTANLIRGFIARCQGLIEKAAGIYLEVASSAKAQDKWEPEFYAEIALCALLTEQGNYLVAQAHLSRARGVIPLPREDFAVHEAIIALRHAALLTSQGKIEAINTLQHVIFIFEHRHLERELGVAELHLAEAYFRANHQADGLSALARAVNLRHAVGSQAYFALEVRALPQVFEVVCCSKLRGTDILYQDWLALEAQSPHEVQLITLGNYAIRLNGQTLTIDSGTAKAVEFLAFLLEEGESRLENIIEQLFDSGSYSTARNRIHKLREAIARQIPGLVIPHNKERNTYHLEPNGVRLRWDVREIRKSLEQGGIIGIQRSLALYSGSFLPRTESDWAERKRFELEFDVAQLGIEALTELFTLERFDECLRLAERLALVASMNLGIQLMLLKATSRVHGAIAARERLLQIDPMLQQDLRVIPELQFELRGVGSEFLN